MFSSCGRSTRAVRSAAASGHDGQRPGWK
jgi:hypothetical protein